MRCVLIDTAEQNRPMETTEGSAATSCPGRGRKRPPSPPTPGDDDDDGAEWLVSDSGSEDDEDRQGNQDSSLLQLQQMTSQHVFLSSFIGCARGKPPFTVDKFPKATCDEQEQINVLYKDPETKLRGPSPLRRYPPYKCGKHVFRADYNLDDKSEVTVSSAEDCFNGCKCDPLCLLQFIDIKIAGYKHVQPGCANIFGFVAMRDTIEPLRNYVYRREINDCEAISVKRKTGVARLSLTSPARVISILTRVLFEFELYVRTESLSEDEPKGDCLIEGCTEFTNLFEPIPFVEHRRLYGERCALDVKYMVLMNAVEARVEVKVLSVSTIAGGVHMKVHAKTSGFDEVIRLFRGAAPEPGSNMTFVVAVERHKNLDLYIEAAPGDDPFVGMEKKPSWQQYSFASGYHGTDEREAEVGEFAQVSVKVTWKSYRMW